jgi:hypothetical protein
MAAFAICRDRSSAVSRLVGIQPLHQPRHARVRPFRHDGRDALRPSGTLKPKLHRLAYRRGAGETYRVKGSQDQRIPWLVVLTRLRSHGRVPAGFMRRRASWSRTAPRVGGISTSAPVRRPEIRGGLHTRHPPASLMRQQLVARIGNRDDRALSPRWSGALKNATAPTPTQPAVGLPVADSSAVVGRAAPIFAPDFPSCQSQQRPTRRRPDPRIVPGVENENDRVGADVRTRARARRTTAKRRSSGEAVFACGGPLK